MKEIKLTLAAIFFSLVIVAQYSENKTISDSGASSQEMIAPEFITSEVAHENLAPGISELSQGIVLSKVYPNPANEVVNFDFVSKTSSSDTKIVIYNLLGVKVKEADIHEKSGTIQIITTDLLEGIYFYSLLVRNHPVVTQKLIIRR